MELVTTPPDSVPKECSQLTRAKDTHNSRNNLNLNAHCSGRCGAIATESRAALDEFNVIPGRTSEACGNERP
eukprot:2811811-Amphidinium_carterae.1